VNSYQIAKALMTKAERAYASARVLLSIGDVDGAANRAYYAMFDAARAALIISNEATDYDIGKTHSGLISAFGNQLIKTGLVSKEMGRLLNRAYETRQIADYNGASVELSDVTEMVENAEFLVIELKTKFI
jgi:uncharacterized protein (UPF0332 family)